MLVVQRRAAPGRGGGVFGEQPGDRVGAQRLASTSREHRIGWAAVVFAEPVGERGDGVGGKRRRAVFASLAVAPNVWPGAQMDVAADESGLVQLKIATDALRLLGFAIYVWTISAQVV